MTEDLCISAERINATAPYAVMQADEMSVRFVTRAGALYDVGFTPDYSLNMDGVYQFYIQNVNKTSFAPDTLIRDTIWAIIEDFFISHENAMLYICETDDGKQQARDRLFKSWFATYLHSDKFEILSAEASFEGECYFASMILSRSNPYLTQYERSFEEFQKSINAKLE